MIYEVILDKGETPNKCTIAPLSYRQDFRIYKVKGAKKLGPFTSTLLLHHEGECLTQIKKTDLKITGIATIDCVWRNLDKLMHKIDGELPILARIPAGFVTAYPRKSELDTDPDGGLATIEAIFVAAALLGNWDPTLLSEYYFGRKFIELNGDLFLKHGIHQAGDEKLWPVLTQRPKSSQRRRQGRGKENKI